VLAIMLHSVDTRCSTNSLIYRPPNLTATADYNRQASEEYEYPSDGYGNSWHTLCLLVIPACMCDEVQLTEECEHSCSCYNIVYLLFKAVVDSCIGILLQTVTCMRMTVAGLQGGMEGVIRRVVRVLWIIMSSRMRACKELSCISWQMCCSRLGSLSLAQFSGVLILSVRALACKNRLC
jgi:hypothetical protein